MRFFFFLLVRLVANGSHSFSYGIKPNGIAGAGAFKEAHSFLTQDVQKSHQTVVTNNSLILSSLLWRKPKSLYKSPNSSPTTSALSAVIRVGSGGGAAEEENGMTGNNTDSLQPFDTIQKVVSSSSSTTVSSYYLIWSPGFAKQFSFATIALGMLHFVMMTINHGPICVHGLVSSSNLMPPLVSNLWMNVFLPLLSSACCFLQLIMNLLVGASGCAGFNKMLGANRPYWLALLVYLTIPKTSVSTAWKSITSWQFAIRLVLTFLPEFLHGWNAYAQRQFHRKNRSSGRNPKDTVQPLEQQVAATIDIEIPTMGCVACITKINTSLRNCGNQEQNRIQEVSSWLEEPISETKDTNETGSQTKTGGRARIRVVAASHQEVESLSETMMQAIAAAGFQKGSTIQSINYNE